MDGLRVACYWFDNFDNFFTFSEKNYKYLFRKRRHIINKCINKKHYNRQMQNNADSVVYI